MSFHLTFTSVPLFWDILQEKKPRLSYYKLEIETESKQNWFSLKQRVSIIETQKGKRWGDEITWPNRLGRKNSQQNRFNASVLPRVHEAWEK